MGYYFLACGSGFLYKAQVSPTQLSLRGVVLRSPAEKKRRWSCVEQNRINPMNTGCTPRRLLCVWPSSSWTVSPGRIRKAFVAMVLTASGTFSAESSPGTVNTGNETWNGNGTYLWEINDVDAGQGTDPGWDLINITGRLNVNANTGNKFTIKITSLTLANAAGVVHDFDNTADYTWTIAKTTTGITGFDPAVFNLDSASFSNALGSGLFIIETANAGNDVVLRFVHRPAIALQPLGGNAECTSNFTFTVTATGTAPLSYQWKHAGTNLPGATSPMLTVGAVAGSAGDYTVEVTNAYGPTNIGVATLTIVDTTPPAITCGQNQTVECGTAWNFTAPVATDGCDGTNVILTIDSTVTNAACGNT